MKKIITTTMILLFFAGMVSAQDQDNQTKVKNNQNSGSKIHYAEDVTISGSLGVGIDMPSGYAFGFSTIAMRENNLRILFDDTSIGTFPANDWQLTANSSDNGGDNYFRLDDITNGISPVTIQSGAGNNAIFVSRTNGRVGFGTSTPARDLHVLSGDTPGIRLQQDGSMGYPSQTWDLYGNEANFNIADGNTGAYSFRIQPGTPTNTLTLRANANVGIGTWSPEHRLEVKGDMQVDSHFYFGDESTDGNWRVSVVGGKLTFEKREAGVWVNKLELD